MTPYCKMVLGSMHLQVILKLELAASCGEANVVHRTKQIHS